MNTAVEVHQPRTAVVDAHTATEIKAQVNRIQEVMRGVMKENAHYGKIPGTDKPTLYKAGSEVLLSTFRIAVEPEVEDLSIGDEIRYRVRAVGRHMASGVTVGAGVGEASSSEEKYKWRRSVCDEEYDETDESRRRIKYVKARNGTIYRNKQIRTEPADVANTVLKMAKKRAQIDMTLTALAASDIFAQDLEDMPESLRDVADEAPRHEPPQGSAEGGKVTEGQLKIIRKKLLDAERTEVECCEAFDVGKLEELSFEAVNDVLAWIKK